MTDYTKGEWEVENHTVLNIGGEVIICDIRTDRERIAESVWPNNAHLIAAAPDMYEALKEMGKYMVANYDDEGKLFYYIDKEWLDKRTAALAKAEGVK